MRVSAMSSEMVHRSRWSRPVVGIGVVVVIGAALGAVFGIRAVTGLGSGSAPASGQPSARTGAAMAYDVADQSVVLFGGQSRTRGLDDTWTWDGSAWSQAHPATSPPALADAQMTFDPVSRQVILIGTEEPAGIELPIACSSSSGSSGSATSKPASIAPDTPIPAIAPVPNATANATAPTTVTSSACGTSLSPRAVTWLWNGSDWSKFTGTTPVVGFGSGTLATDPVAGRVVLLTRGPFAEPAVGVAQPACPLQSAATPDRQPMCPFIPEVAPDWTWNGHAWKEMTANAGSSSFNLIGTTIVVDAVTGRLATFSGGDFIAPVPAPPTCEGCVGGAPEPAASSTCCTGTESTWNGTSWKEVATYRDGPFTSGVTFVGDPATHSDVALAGDGTTWIWTGTWKQVHPGTTPPIVSSSASAYDAATGQVVMFGGYGVTSRATGLYDQTWTWDGSDWTQRGGTSGPSVSIPVPSPGSVPPGLPCEPVTAPKSPLGVPVAAPQTTCNGVNGIGTGSSGSAGGVAGGSGVAAP
jgi:hypothetical protein